MYRKYQVAVLISALAAASAFSQAHATDVMAQNSTTGELAFANVALPYWYLDRPAAPISPYAGQPYGYDPQLAAPPYAGQSQAQAAKPGAPVSFPTRRRYANYIPQALEQGPRPCKPATKCW